MHWADSGDGGTSHMRIEGEVAYRSSLLLCLLLMGTGASWMLLNGMPVLPRLPASFSFSPQGPFLSVVSPCYPKYTAPPMLSVPSRTLMPHFLWLPSCCPPSSPSSSPQLLPLLFPQPILFPCHVLFSRVLLSLRTSQQKLREQVALFKQIKSHSQPVCIYSSRSTVTRMTGELNKQDGHQQSR